MATAVYPGAVVGVDKLPFAGDALEVETTLTEAIASGTAAPFTLKATALSDFPAANGYVVVGSSGNRELMRYDTRTATTANIVQRGISAGGANAHALGNALFGSMVPTYHDQVVAELKAIEGGLLNGFTHDLKVGATNKLYLDGGSNTYLYESSADRIDAVVGGGLALRLTTTYIEAPATHDLRIAATKRLYFDGGSNTYIYEQAADVLQCVSGGSGGVKLTSGATSWAAVSDERLKKIIEPIENACDKLRGWRTVIGRFNDDDAGRRRAFLIAQDVQRVLPEAVTEAEDGILVLRYDDTIPLLVAAINELSAAVAKNKKAA